MPIRKKRAAIYSRYSSQHQTELSVEGQTERMLEYCKRNKFEIVKQYVDRGVSAFLIEKRLDFLKLIEDAMESKFDYVIVWSSDRFARSRLDARKYKELLREYGIKVMAVSEPSVEGPEQILLEGNQETLAEYFAGKLARDSMRGMITKAKKGRFLGGVVPFGYEKYKINERDWGFRIDEREAKVVRKIFEMRAEGTPVQTIAHYLNQLGYKTRRGKDFTSPSVDWILGNPKYKGVYEFNNRKHKGRFNYYTDEIVRVTMPELAIVPAQLWQRVQKVAGIKKKPKLIYLLRAKIFCGDCDYPLAGTTYGGKKNKAGGYICTNCKRKYGKYLKIGGAKTENYVINCLRDQIASANVSQLLEMVNSKINSMKNQGQLEDIKAEIEATNTGISNITKAVETGAYSQALLDRLSQLERKKEELLQELSKLRLQQVKFTKVDKNEIESFLEMFVDTESFQMKHDLINFTLNRVVVIWNEPRVLEVHSIFERRKILFL